MLVDISLVIIQSLEFVKMFLLLFLKYEGLTPGDYPGDNDEYIVNAD